MKLAASPTVITAAVIIAFLAATGFLARRPYYNWDMFPYMALAMQRPGVPFETTHREVYQAARANMPASDFEAISARQPVMKETAGLFELILPYFRIKPGYNLLVSTMYKLGVHPLTATWLPSIVSYLAIGLMLFFWCQQHGPPVPAAIFTFVIMFNPVMANLARYSSPDMLCAAVFLAGLFLILGSKQLIGLMLLTAAVTIRPDAAILTVLLVLAMWLSRKISLIHGLSWFVAQLVIVYTIFLSEPGLAQAYFALTVDLFGKSSEVSHTLLNSLTIPMSGIALLLIFLRRKEGHPDLLSLLLWAALLSLLARFILHPYVEDRFNLSAYLVILVVGWEYVMTRFFSTDGLKPLFKS